MKRDKMKQTYVSVLLLLSTCVALARQSPAETAVSTGTFLLGGCEGTRSGELSKIVASEFCRLALLERPAATEGSHHRLDHFADREGPASQILCAGTGRQPGDRQHRHNLLLVHDGLGGQERPRRAIAQAALYAYLDESRPGMADHRRDGRSGDESEKRAAQPAAALFRERTRPACCLPRSSVGFRRRRRALRCDAYTLAQVEIGAVKA